MADEEKRIIDNSDRPAQPEPGEDPAVENPPDIREQGTTRRVKEPDDEESARKD